MGWDGSRRNFPYLLALTATLAALATVSGSSGGATSAGIPIDRVGRLNRSWSGWTDGAVRSAPTVSGDTVFVATSAGTLAAFTTHTDEEILRCSWATRCSPKWTGRLAGPSTSSPVVVGGLVYVASMAGKVQAFFANGCPGGSCPSVYSTRALGPIVGSPVVAGGILYVGSEDGTVAAYDPSGIQGCAGGVCAPLWRGLAGGPVESTPTLGNGDVFVTTTTGNVVGFDAAGRVGCSAGVCLPRWTAATGAAIHASPNVADGLVAVGSDDGVLRTYDATGRSGCAGTPLVCAPLWSAAAGAAIRTTPAVGDGLVVVGTDGGRVVAYDRVGATGCDRPTTCPARWATQLLSAVRGSPATADHVVYVGTDDGTLAAYDLTGSAASCGRDAAHCTALWSSVQPRPASPPRITPGIVYVGSGAGVHAFRVVASSESPAIRTETLSAERADAFSVVPDGEAITVAAAGTNTAGSTRFMFSLPPATVAQDLVSCATWNGDRAWWDQEGAVLRAHSIPGGFRAITVTKNIWFSAHWIFNVHVWDTTRYPIAMQIGAFDLHSVFFPAGRQTPGPWRLCARTVGGVVSFRVWPTSQPAPSWGDPRYGGSVVLPPGWGDPGIAGWYVGHLRATDWASFSGLAVQAVASGTATVTGARVATAEAIPP